MIIKSPLVRSLLAKAPWDLPFTNKEDGPLFSSKRVCHEHDCDPELVSLFA